MPSDWSNLILQCQLLYVYAFIVNSHDLSFAASTHFVLLKLCCIGPQLRLVLQVSRLCPQPIAAARAPKAIPFYEYFTYLASSLTYCIPACPHRFLCFVTNAYSLTSQFPVLPPNIIGAFRLYNNSSTYFISAIN
jgi:hypothetical protein